MESTVPLPSRARGMTVFNVMEPPNDLDVFAPKADGVTDDTDAIMSFINELPSAGGTVHVPAGVYAIDAERSVRLRRRMFFDMHPEAVFKAIPNGNRTYRLIVAEGIEDVEVAIGHLIGDRDEHVYTDYGSEAWNTHEWGHGLAIRRCKRVTARAARGSGIIEGCTGDGLAIYGDDIVADGLQCIRNRRQGTSVTGGRGVVLRGLKLSGTEGTIPQCGIDLEPDAGSFLSDVLIDGVESVDNAAYGLQILANVSNVRVINSNLSRNKFGIVTARACSNIIIGEPDAGNEIRDNQDVGIFLKLGTDKVRIAGNRFSGNVAKHPLEVPRKPVDMEGIVPKKTSRDINPGGCTNLAVGVNHYE